MACDVRALCKQGRLKEALDILDLMDEKCMKAHSNAYMFLLQACIGLKALTEAKHVHAHILKSGFKANVFLETTLIDLYAKCGSIDDACKVFYKIHKRDVISWNTIIAGYAQHRDPEQAFEFFFQMEQDGVVPDGATFVSIIKICGRLGNLERGKQIHGHIIKTGIKQDLLVKNTLIDMYAKCGSMDDAYQIFERMPLCTVVTWTAIIAGYAKHGHGENALKLFWQMQKEGVKPDEVTFLGVLNACASIGNLEQGKELHAHILQSGVKPNMFMENALVDMYAKCGSMENAHLVFKRLYRRDVISWTAMISGFVKLGRAKEAFNFFWQMQEEGVKPNEVTFLSILNACAILSAFEEGKQIHAYIIKIGIKANTFMESTLVDMYAKCGHIENARQVFDQMCRRDTISWNAMITGYTQKGHPEEAFRLFQQMKQEGIRPDEGTFVSILNTCASIAALEKGKEIHADVIKSRFDLDVFVGSALVDMYAKCANIRSAKCVLDKMPERDVVLWTAMITGYAHNGHDEDVLQIVKQMRKEGVKLNDVTFLGALLACSHAGLVDEGCQFFESMSQEQGIIPRMEHYTCMVDLLGRAGRLEEAETFTRKMTCRPSAGVWMALLGACRTYGHVELAERVTDAILKLEPQNSSVLVLLANIYAGAHRWVDQADMMKDMGVLEKPGHSFIEVNNTVHMFAAENMLHPQGKEIFAELKRLYAQIEEGGYAPKQHFAFHDSDEWNKFPFTFHSEQLATAFGLISTPIGTPIRVITNFRLCDDCHIVMKFFSKLVERDFFVRDATRFHHFKDGVCSCGDYW